MEIGGFELSTKLWSIHPHESLALIGWAPEGVNEGNRKCDLGHRDCSMKVLHRLSM